MKTVRVGGVYFLDPPFYLDKSDAESTIQCKRLSYLMGTCSSRPAVVVREPLFFDRYNTVTVIPALSRGDPAITFKLTDRYGNEGDTEYRFVPHNPHTIPVSRLGRYIASLDQKELDLLLEAFHWIHDPNSITHIGDPDYPVPELYREAFSRPRFPSWKTNRDARSDVVINVGIDGRLRSETNPELNGFLVDTRRMPPQVTAAIHEDMPYEKTESPLPESVHTDEGIPAVPVEREFPDSMFSKDVLNRVASRFGISEAYYRNNVEKRDIVALADNEFPSFVSGLSMAEIDQVREIYDRMTPVDAILFWPRLQSDVLAYYASVPKQVVVALKKICNRLRDMTPDEYASRMKVYDGGRGVDQQVQESEPEKPEVAPSKKVDYRQQLDAIRPYLTTSKVKIMPDDIARMFLDLPMARVKHAWSGPNFKESYNSARNFYRAKFKSSVEV